jgi:hypothetical protein
MKVLMVNSFGRSLPAPEDGAGAEDSMGDGEAMGEDEATGAEDSTGAGVDEAAGAAGVGVAVTFATTLALALALPDVVGVAGSASDAPPHDPTGPPGALYVVASKPL